jgi:hypothetical protein
MRARLGYLSVWFAGVAIGSALGSNMPNFGSIISLAALVVAFVLVAVVAKGPWARINSTGDHGAPFRIHKGDGE